MAYIDQLLSSHEQIVFVTRRHFFVILGAVLKELLILLVLGVAMFAVYQWEPAEITLLQGLIGGVCVLVLFSMLIDVVRWRNEQFVVTSRRVFHIQGIFNKRVLDSSLNKINDVVLEQSWMGRIFGYGTIRILTATEEVINLLDRVHKPLDLKRAMLEAKSAMEPIGASVTGPGVSVSQLLEELSEMKEKGMISEEEYQEKRKEILKRM